MGGGGEGVVLISVSLVYPRNLLGYVKYGEIKLAVKCG
jgi:hypothetical protein